MSTTGQKEVLAALTAVETGMKVEMPAVQTRYTADEEQVILNAVRQCKTFSQGDELRAFEEEFAEYVGSPAAVGLSSCTAALEMAAIVSGIGPGDEVIVPGHTFVSSVVPFVRSGAKLIFADIDPETRVIGAETIAPKLSDRTRVIVAVHLYGLMADMNLIMEIARARDLIVVEDCAQSPGAAWNGQRAGSFGDFGCFSFHTHKNMSTLGEGGMLTVRSEEAAETVKKLRWMGNWPFEETRERYWMPAMGSLEPALEGVWPLNYCLGEIQAAVGRAVLKRLDEINEGRRRQAARFRGKLAEVNELSFQRVDEPKRHVYHLMSARFDGAEFGTNRDDLIELLHEEYGIKCIVQYWPLYRSPLFRSFGYGDQRCPKADHFYDNMISFPWWSDMPDDVLDYMAESTAAAIGTLKAR